MSPIRITPTPCDKKSALLKANPFMKWETRPNLVQLHPLGILNGISSFFIGSKDLPFLIFPSLTNRSFSFLILSSSRLAGSSPASCVPSFPCTASCKISSRSRAMPSGAVASVAKCSKRRSLLISFSLRKVSRAMPSVPALTHRGLPLPPPGSARTRGAVLRDRRVRPL